MKATICLVVPVLLLLVGCSGEDEVWEARLVEYDRFAQKVYTALSQEDVEALLNLCALPSDLDQSGQPLVNATDTRFGGLTLEEQHVSTIERFFDSLDDKGGASSMQLVEIGKPIGIMSMESDFVGNMFLVVNLDGKKQTIEIDCTQMSQNRGRLIVGGSLFTVKTMEYYLEMASIF